MNVVISLICGLAGRLASRALSSQPITCNWLLFEHHVHSATRQYLHASCSACAVAGCCCCCCSLLNLEAVCSLALAVAVAMPCGAL